MDGTVFNLVPQFYTFAFTVLLSPEITKAMRRGHRENDRVSEDEGINAHDEHFNKFAGKCKYVRDHRTLGTKFNSVLNGIKKEGEEKSKKNGREEHRGTK
jgi:hypothetical protein